MQTGCTLTFSVPLMMIEETNHLEQRRPDRFSDGRPVRTCQVSKTVQWDGEAQVTVRFRPHEIKTFRLRLAVPGFAIYEGAEHREERDPGAVPGFGDG